MKYYALICLLLWFHSVFGQERTTSLLFDHPVFQNYSMKDGLTSNYCYDVLQDKKGAIWIATLNGLNRFNGNRWETFQQQTEIKRKRLPANWVIDMDEEAGKGIWINTDRGIAFYDFAGDSIQRFSEPVKGWGKIAVLGSSQILVSSWTGLEVFQKKKNQLQSLRKFPETSGNSFPLLYRSPDGTIWTCPEDHPSLIRWNPLTGKLSYVRQLVFRGKKISPVIKGIFQLNPKQILLATRQNGLLIYTIGSDRVEAFFPNEFPDQTQYSQLTRYRMDGERFLIIGTQSEGLIVWNERTHKRSAIRYNPSDPKSLCSNQILTLHTDNNQGIWIATSMGISYFHPSLQKNKSYHFHNREAFRNGILINAVFPLRGNSFLIGTEHNGLFLYDANSDELVTIQSSLNQVSCITQTNSGILVGSKDGVFRFQAKSRKLEAKPLVKGSILRIRQLNDSVIAYCTQTGLKLFDWRQKKFIFQESLKPDAPEKLFCKDVCLKNGKLWILRFFDGWEVREYPGFKTLFVPEPSRLKLPVDYHCIQTSDSFVYIATSAGIIRQQVNNLRKITYLKTSDGLAGDGIENLLIPDKHRLFYTTVDGLYVYYLKSKTSKRLFSYENYGQKWYNQLELSKHGTLLYNVSDYFCSYTINNRFNNTKTPSLEIEKVLINNQLVQIPENKLDLSNQENTIRIYLAAYVYPESGKNKWVYQLNQQEQKASDGLIELQNLPPDDYKLTIYSINNEGVRSRSSKSLLITIAPPFYNTWWFLLLVFLFLFGVFGLFYGYKRYQNIRLLRIRNQISRDLHDELGANVSSIHIMANMLQTNPDSPQAKTALQNISRYSVQISDTINDIIWNINPQFDSVEELIKRMTRYASETIEGTPIEYDLNLPKNSTAFRLDNRTKYHLYLIFKESVNNAVKHSKATRIEIDFQLNGRQFGFYVRDNGSGFDLKAPARGNGIHNLQSRSKEIGAAIFISASPGKGTLVELIIQLT